MLMLLFQARPQSREVRPLSLSPPLGVVVDVIVSSFIINTNF